MSSRTGSGAGCLRRSGPPRGGVPVLAWGSDRQCAFRGPVPAPSIRVDSAPDRVDTSGQVLGDPKPLLREQSHACGGRPVACDRGDHLYRRPVAGDQLEPSCRPQPDWWFTVDEDRDGPSGRRGSRPYRQTEVVDELLGGILAVSPCERQGGDHRRRHRQASNPARGLEHHPRPVGLSDSRPAS